MMTKPRGYNQELMKGRRSPSLMTTTNEKDLDLDHNKTISPHQERTSRITKGITNSLIKTSTEGDLTMKIIEMIIGIEIFLSSRTTSVPSITTTISLQVVDRPFLILIYEPIPPTMEIYQIAHITSMHDRKTQILSTSGTSPPTTTVSQTPYSSLTTKDKTELVQYRSIL